MEQDPDIGIGVIGTKTENPTDHLHRAMKDTIMDRQEAFLDLTTFLGRKPTVFNRGMNATCM